ncbi:MAG TPA: creatininase family protein [Candidatus Bathyarchaeia archaeon]|nr:creatininase family protein [Candidatus Bathyarchaeia archaeon]
MNRAEKFLLGELTADQINEIKKNVEMVLLPMGSAEQHGSHLPISTDSIIAYEISREVAKRISSKFTVLVAPLIPIGKSIEHMSFGGTITFETETLTRVVKDVCKSLVKDGFQKIVFVNGHGGNTLLLQDIIRDIRYETGAFLAIIDWFTGLLAETLEKAGLKPLDVFHACYLETSLLMYLRPELVRSDKIESEKPYQYTADTGYKHLKLDSRTVNFSWLTKDISRKGVIGDPTKASKEDGQKFFNLIVEQICEVLTEIKKVPRG